MSSKKLNAKIVVVAIVAGFCFWGCKKDDASTKPILKLKSISSYSVPQKGFLTITLECSNVSVLKSSASDTALGVQFVVINAASCSNAGSKSKITTYDLPNADATTGTSQIVLGWVNNSVTYPTGYGFLPTANCRPIDSTYIKFWVKTTDGITSDTVTTDRPILIYN